MILGNYYHASKWIEAGNNVNIIAASFSHARRVNPNVIRFSKTEKINGVPYHWLRTFAHDGDNRVGRIVNLVVFPIVFFFYSPFLIRAKYDVVICSLPNPFLSIPAYLLARLTGAKFTVEVRDIWPESLVEVGGVSSTSYFIRLLKSVSRFAYRKADLIVSVLPSMDKYLRENNIATPCVHVPNGCNPSVSGLDNENVSAACQDIVNLIRELKNKGNFVIGYTGKLGASNGIRTMLKSIALLKNTSVSLVIVGDGDLAQSMKKYAEEIGVSEQVFFVGSVDHGDVDALLSNFHTLLVCVSKSPIYKYGLSLTKVNEYMLSGRPVIYSADDLHDPVTLAKCGISCSAQDHEDIANAIEKMSSMTDSQLSVLGSQGRAWAIENRSYDALSKRYLIALKNI